MVQEQSYFPLNLLPETTTDRAGDGPAIEIARENAKLWVLTLVITRAVEQESLHVSVRGSHDSINWDANPLVAFTHKSYCGVYSVLLNLSARLSTSYLKIEWRMSKWAKAPERNHFGSFGFFVDAEASGSRIPGGIGLVCDSRI